MTGRKTDSKKGIWSYWNLWKYNTKSSWNSQRGTRGKGQKTKP